jgi:hypothetical protein
LSEAVVPDAARDEESPTAHNQDVKWGLTEYCRFPHSQGFAVMRSGRWGSGKTYFINSILNDLVQPGKDAKKYRPLSVSLYGVRDSSEIGDQLFQQLHPVLGHKATRLFGAVLRSVAKATVKVDVAHMADVSGVLPDLDLSSLLNGSEGRVIVFDDFERAAMSPVTILGYINPLVEHDDCKVIVIADENQIPEGDEYWRRKEKTIGRTFEFKPDADTAFAAFSALIDDTGARTCLEASKATILQIFSDSGLDNLRLLNQFMWDFERLWKTLTPEQRQHAIAMHELVSLVCASAIELRSGGLTAKTFRRADASHYFRLRNASSDTTAKTAQTEVVPKSWTGS